MKEKPREYKAGLRNGKMQSISTAFKGTKVKGKIDNKKRTISCRDKEREGNAEMDRIKEK